MKFIGVLALQGDVSEHVASLERAARNICLKCSVEEVKYPLELKKIDALALPGGESTTIGKLLVKHKIFDILKQRIGEGMPVLATCAGMVLMAKEGDSQVEKTSQPLLGVMDYKVNRNAFGRQRESFEAELNIPALGRKKFHSVFIRAPAVSRAWGKAKALARHEGRIVLVRQDRMISCAFHPELSDDTRLHEYFLKLI
jgi:5'-phosphate synthase pdxT subunit